MSTGGKNMTNFNRLTRRKDEYECRIVDCPIYEGSNNWCVEDDPCKACPFEKYINRLAELEDFVEEMEDDRK